MSVILFIISLLIYLILTSLETIKREHIEYKASHKEDRCHCTTLRGKHHEIHN